MAKKKKKKTGDPKLEPFRIWLAGVGAASRAEEGDVDFFEELVANGRKALSARGTRLKKSFEKLSGDFRVWVESTTDDVGSRVGQYVSEAVQRLGVPSSETIAELTRRIDELGARVQQMEGPQRGAAATEIQVVWTGEQWVVRLGEKSEAHPTKAEALKAARALAAASRPCVLVTHKRDGSVQTEKAFE